MPNSEIGSFVFKKVNSFGNKLPSHVNGPLSLELYFKYFERKIGNSFVSIPTTLDWNENVLDDLMDNVVTYFIPDDWKTGGYLAVMVQLKEDFHAMFHLLVSKLPDCEEYRVSWNCRYYGANIHTLSKDIKKFIQDRLDKLAPIDTEKSASMTFTGKGDEIRQPNIF